MCGIAKKLDAPGASQMDKFYGDSGVGKINSKMNPLGAFIVTGNKGKLDPLNLKNDPADIPLPPALQEAKDPDSMALRRKSRSGNAGGGTLLTSPSGVAPSLMNTGGTTLLGG